MVESAPDYGNDKAIQKAREFWNKHKNKINLYDGAHKLHLLMELMDAHLKASRYTINDHVQGFIVNVVYSFIREHEMYPSRQWIKAFEWWPRKFPKNAILFYFPWMKF